MSDAMRTMAGTKLTNRKVALAWCAMGKGAHATPSWDVDGAPVVVVVMLSRASGAAALARARMGGPNAKGRAAWMRTCLGKSVCFLEMRFFHAVFFYFLFFIFYFFIFDR